MARIPYNLRKVEANQFLDHPPLGQPARKGQLERFLKSFEDFLTRHEGHFGKPTRIYDDNSNEFVNVKYLVAFVKMAAEEKVADMRDGENPDAA
jgi:hypothetical protein